MANLKVAIVVRTALPGGKRGWVPATGKNDPAGPLYLRWYEGSSAKHLFAGKHYDEAEAAQLKQERKLKASSQGFIVPEEANTKKFHRGHDCLDAYLKFLRSTTKRNGRRYNERSILSRESNIREFINLTKKPFVEQYNRADILAYKEFLYGQKKANDTVYNKLGVIVTWLKHNQVVSITGLMKTADWPLKRRTKPQPFRQAEVDAMMANAGEHKLLLRLARGTGMRKGELVHAERSDIDTFGHFIRVGNKPKYEWETKTVASIRDIPLGDDLLRDLLKLPEGLLFPAPEGGPDDHIDRRFQAVGEAAGVKPPKDDKASWCHRWRDTYATDLVRSKKLQLRDIAVLMGHEDLKTMDLYAEHVRMESQEARDAANVVDSHGDKPGPRIVRKSA